MVMSLLRSARADMKEPGVLESAGREAVGMGVGGVEAGGGLQARAGKADTRPEADVLEDSAGAGVFRVVVPASGLVASGERLGLLAFDRVGLVPARVVSGDGEVVFEFDLFGCRPGVSLRGVERVERLRFLVNVAGLESLAGVYDFSLALENLVVADGLTPRVLRRDLVPAGAGGGAGFLGRYLALAGELLAGGGYEDFLDGGSDLFGRDRLLGELAGLGSVGAVRDRLLGAWEGNVARERVARVRVSRRWWLGLKVAVPVLVACLVATGFVAWRSTQRVLPAREQVIAASQAYVGGDFLGVQVALSGVGLEGMSFETRHLLARAYVVSLPMPDEQRAFVQAGLTRLAEQELFDYWILLGRSDFAGALGVAHRFGDRQLELMVYSNEYAYLQANPLVEGRAERMTYLRGVIDREITERERAAAELEAEGADA